MLPYHVGKAPCTGALLKVYFEIFRYSHSVCRLYANKRVPILARELPGREWCNWCWETDCCRSFLISSIRTSQFPDSFVCPFIPIISHMGGSICQCRGPLFRESRANNSVSEAPPGSWQTETRCSSPVEYITCQKYLASGECRRLDPVTNNLPSHDGKSGPDRQRRLDVLCDVWQGEAGLFMLTALPFTTGGPELDLCDCATSHCPAAPIRWHWDVAVDAAQAGRAGRASRPEWLAVQPRTAGTDCWT